MELLERAEHLDALKELLEETRQGAGRLVFVAGEAGAGKSALVQRFSDVASIGARVMCGWCDPLATPRPFGPLVDVAPVLGESVTALLTSGVRQGLFEAALNALAGGPLPSLFAIEDAQWADEGTLDLIRFFGRRLGAVPALIVVTYREDEVDASHPLRIVLGDLASAPAVRRLSVAPLSEDSVQYLCAGSPIDAAALHEHSGGNAFFVTEVLASGATGVPPAVSDAVLARAARLSPAGRAALDTAAVIGARIEPCLLLEVAGVDAVAVDECLTAGMLRFIPPAFAFRHELARQAILGAIPTYRRRDLHGQVLDALRSGDPGPDVLARLAEHAEAADDATAVLEYATAAARRATQLKAHREAEAQLARALRFTGSAAPEVCAELYDGHAFECYLVDHLDDAVSSGEAALQLWRRLGRPLRAGDVLRRLSRTYWYRGDNLRAEQAGREALEALEPLPPGREMAMAWSNQSQLGMLASDVERATTWGYRAIALAREIGDTETLVHALNNVGSARLCCGDDSAEELLLESVALGVEAGLDDDVARGWHNLADCWTRRLDFPRARRFLRDEILYCEQHELYTSAYCARSDLASLNYLEGRWDEADEAAAQLLEERQMARVSRICALITRGRVAVRRGDAAAWRWLDEALAFVPADELQYLGRVTAARAEGLWLSGRSAEIEDAVRPVLGRAVAVADKWMIGELSFWLWRAGVLEHPVPGALEPYARQVAGDWRGSAEMWRDLGLPYEAAFALLDGDEAAVLEALVEFERMGAKPAAAEASRRLRSFGARVPRGPRASTSADIDGLTAREQEVLDCLTDNLTNAEIAARLFLSEKTVAHHVSSIIGKLGVRSRAQAVDARRGRQVAVARS